MKLAKTGLSKYLDDLQTEGQYYFSRKKVIEAARLSEGAFKLAVSRLIKSGRVKRIYSDFYVLVPLEYKEAGILPASWFIDDLMHHLQTGYYIGLLSAAALYGAAHQQPMVFQTISNQVINPIKSGRLRMEFYYKKVIHPSFSRPVKTETGAMQVSTPEMTAYDLLRYIDAAGQINNVATVLCELGAQIKIEQLLDYAKNGFLEVAVMQRLGYLLEYLQINVDLDELADWIKSNQPRYYLLVSGSSAPIIGRNKSWHILVNENVEPDI